MKGFAIYIAPRRPMACSATRSSRAWVFANLTDRRADGHAEGPRPVPTASPAWSGSRPCRPASARMVNKNVLPTPASLATEHRESLHQLRLVAVRVDHKKFQISLPDRETPSRRYAAEA